MKFPTYLWNIETIWSAIVVLMSLKVCTSGWMDPKSRQLILSLQLELIDRWPPSIAYHNSLRGTGFATNQGHSPWCFHHSSHHSLVWTHFLAMNYDKQEGGHLSTSSSGKLSISCRLLGSIHPQVQIFRLHQYNNR